MDLLHTKLFYQCLVDFLLNLIINLFFQILSLQLLIFYMDDLEYIANFNYLWFYFYQHNHQSLLFIFIIVALFHCNFSRIKSFTISISLSHTLKKFVSYGYVSIPPNVCVLLSSLLLNAILFTSCLYTS